MSRARDCQQCDGDGELVHTGETMVDFIYRRRGRVRGLYQAIRLCMRNIHTYRAEGCARGDDWRSDQRIIACLERVWAYRLSIRSLRAETWPKFGHLAWCVACRGTGLSNNECDGCGDPVSMGDRNDAALECADILVHQSCDTGHRFFEVAS